MYGPIFSTNAYTPQVGLCANFGALPIELSFVPKPAPPELTKTSEWAEKSLNFTPTAKQAEVLDSDAKYLMLCCNRQWGKTTTVSIKALHCALQTPKLRIVVIASSLEQAGLLIESATDFARTLGLPIRRVLGQPSSLKLPNGSFICAVPHTMDTSLGRSAGILIVDEAAVVKDEVFFTVSPAVSRTHGRLWLLSTPRRQSGFFYNYWHDETATWHRVFSTVADCPDIDADFLEMQRRANPVKYQQDFLCEFVQPANRLCTREFVRSMLRNADPPTGKKSLLPRTQPEMHRPHHGRRITYR